MRMGELAQAEYTKKLRFAVSKLLRAWDRAEYTIKETYDPANCDACTDEEYCDICPEVIELFKRLGRLKDVVNTE